MVVTVTAAIRGTEGMRNDERGSEEGNGVMMLKPAAEMGKLRVATEGSGHVGAAISQ